MRLSLSYLGLYPAENIYNDILFFKKTDWVENYCSHRDALEVLEAEGFNLVLFLGLARHPSTLLFPSHPC
jgi:hypothetical protein